MLGGRTDGSSKEVGTFHFEYGCTKHTLAAPTAAVADAACGHDGSHGRQNAGGMTVDPHQATCVSGLLDFSDNDRNLKGSKL